MGLSNSERINKIYWGIDRLTKLGRDLEGHDYQKIKILIESLWPAILANQGNSLFWVFGSCEEVSFDKTTLWSVALGEVISCSSGKEDNSWKKEYPPDYIKDMLSIEYFLEKNLSTIYKISQWCEQIKYASNRYEDELSRDLEKLNFTIAQVEGECFHFFKNTEDCAVAWLLHEISKKIYGEKWEWTKVEDLDPLQKYLLKECVHHQIPSLYKECYPNRIKYLKEMLLTLEEDNSSKNRMKATIIIQAKNLAEYSHQRVALQKVLPEFDLDLKEFIPYIRPHEIRKKKKELKNISSYQEERKYYRKELLK